MLLIGVQVACGSTQNATADKAAALPAPTFARTVKLQPVSGRVLIAVPRATGFVLLSAARLVPVGTVVDSTTGKLNLTTASPPTVAPHTGQFHGGIFRITQPRGEGGQTDLTIRNNLGPSACRTTAAAASAPAGKHGKPKLSHRILGLLRGSAHGGFRTVGKFSAATVRGTQWGVRNRCDGTLTVDTEGVVAVRDFRLHKNIILRTGQTYLAT